MKEKIFSFLKRGQVALAIRLKKITLAFKEKLGGENSAFRQKRISIPSLMKIIYVLRSFSIWEKSAFLILTVFSISAGLGILWKIDQSLAVEIPRSGGALKEGIIGTPRFINPLFEKVDTTRFREGLGEIL